MYQQFSIVQSHESNILTSEDSFQPKKGVYHRFFIVATISTNESIDLEEKMIMFSSKITYLIFSVVVTVSEND